MAESYTTPKKALATDAKGIPEPSPLEARFFFSIIKNMANKPDVDWAAVAEDNGMKNAKVAAVSPPPSFCSPLPFMYGTMLI